VEEELIRLRLGELRAELQRRSVRNPRSARSSASRGTNDAALEDVDRAMRMLEKGTYGICEACGRPIPAERLEVHPAARFCLEDQQNLER
jgi:RNA polymerase-binding transcription factor DksA